MAYGSHAPSAHPCQLVWRHPTHSGPAPPPPWAPSSLALGIIPAHLPGQAHRGHLLGGTRLTSFLLLLLYFGYMLWNAIEDEPRRPRRRHPGAGGRGEYLTIINSSVERVEHLHQGESIMSGQDRAEATGAAPTDDGDMSLFFITL